MDPHHYPHQTFNPRQFYGPTPPPQKFYRPTPPTSPAPKIDPRYPRYLADSKFNCCLEIQSEIAARISIYTLNLLKLPSNQVHI